MRVPVAALAAAVVSGCVSGDRPPDDPDFELTLAQQLAIDVTTVKPGDWAIYAVRQQGEPQARHIKYSVVAQEGAALWVENKIPYESGFWVYKFKFDRSGRLLELWGGEPGGIPAQSYPNPKRPNDPPPRRDSGAAAASTQREPDRIKLRDRTYACTKITSTLVYDDGRRRTMVNWFSQDVPSWLGAADATSGGLIRRQLGVFTMELFDHGNTPRPLPELMIPR